jgi:cystathionine beta-lyase/cystathionine gamma-synthase
MPKIFFVESCTNPSGQMFNPETIAILKNICPSCIFVVDNTWLSGISYNPFEHDVDIVVESMSKYISDGKCIGGMIIGKAPYMIHIQETIRINGIYIGLDHCNIFRDNLKTIETRIKESSYKTQIIAEYLENIQFISRVLYPGLQSHPTYNVCIKYIKYMPSVIWFHIKSDINSYSTLQKLLTDNCPFAYETSFGGDHDKLDTWPIVGHNGWHEIELSLQDSIPGVWLRLSIGNKSDINSIKDNIDKLVSLFQKN